MITLQHVIPPQQGLCTEPELYYRLEGPAFARDASGEFLLEAGAGVRFDTYFNLLSIGKWHAACRIEGLHLVLTGQGQMEVRAYLAVPDRSWERLCCEIVTLDPEAETRIDLSHYALNDTRGVIWFEVRALAPRRGGRLIAARYEAPLPEGTALPKLAVLVPQTDRAVEVDDEDAAEFPARARMMRARLAGWAEARGATVIADDDAEAGLARAVAGGATHVIRIDPRAVVATESLDRVHAFLTLAADREVALTASDLHVTEKWRSGAILRTSDGTEPLFQGADLRDRQEVLTIEHETILIESGLILPHRDFLAAAVNPATGGLPAKPVVVTLNGLALLPTPEEAVTGRLAVLQELLFPVQGISTEQDLFFHLAGAAGFQSGNASGRATGKTGPSGGGAVTLAPGAMVLFDSYFNAFSLAKWHALCRLDGLFLAIRGTGRVEVKVFHAIPDRSWEQLLSEVVTLSRSRSTRFDLSHYVLNSTDGVIYFEVRCVDRDRPASVTGAEFLTRAPRGGKTAATQLLWLPEPPKPGEDNAQELALDAAMRERITAWARAAGVKIVTSDTPEALDRHLSAIRPTLLVKANPGALFLPGMLDRAFAFLRLSRDPSVALTASTFHKTDRFRAGQIYAQASAASRRLSELGLRARAMLPDMDLRDRAAVIFVEGETADLPAGSVEAQPDFLAISLPAGSVPAAVTASEGRRVLTLNGLILVPAPEMVVELGLTTIQHLIFPEQGICTEQDLFFHLAGAATFQGGMGAGAAARPTITLDPGGAAFFDTYFNALSIGKWHAACDLDGLFLGLRGSGRLEVKVFHAIPDRSWELLVSEVVGLSRSRDTILDLSHYVMNAVNGVIYFEVRAVDPVRPATITAARYMTRSLPAEDVNLAVSITTFKREEQVESTAARLHAFLETSDFKGRVQVFVVDNGKSAEILASPHITVIPNANLGGAGGFSRGLVEAEARGISHVLFMDDDASILMENIHRAFAFFALATDKKVAIAGAMINNSDKWRMWENGAIFDRKCMPLFSGVDLRTREGVMHLEFESHRRRPDKMYGGWWFFAFPVAQVSRHPFPFFVRGDDVNFSLVNDFHITTLNGVVSFQDDFTDKESPLTWYLDLRSHMVHHLTLEKMEVGRLRLAHMGVWFYMRNVVKFQYETIDAVLLAWSHVLKGPDFFVQNADASGPRAQIKALTKTEAWKPISELDLTERRRLHAEGGWRGQLMKVLFNGQLVPFWNLIGNRVVVAPQDRGAYWPIWGASRITYLNSTREKGYTVTQSKRRFAGTMLRLIWLWLRMVLGYGALRAKYRRRYPEITTRGFWESTLGVSRPEAEVAEAELVEGAAGETKPAEVAGAEAAAEGEAAADPKGQAARPAMGMATAK